MHRDLKPANLLVTAEGLLKVADFGIARSLLETHTRQTGDLRGASGTLAFMGPQQLESKGKPAPADDLYSLGATLYDLLTGKPPFYGADIFTEIRMGVPVPLLERRAELENTGAPIPPAWERTIFACLAKRAEDRPASAGAVLALLDGLAPPADKTVPITASAPELERSAVLQPALTGSDEPKWRGLKLRATSSWRWLWLGLAGPTTNAPAPAHVLPAREFTVTVDPPDAGAHLWLGPQSDVAVKDGKALLKDLPDGEHELIVQAAAYQPFTTRVTVKEGRGSAEVRLVALKGALSVKARPGTVVTAVDAAGRETRLGSVPATGSMAVENLLRIGAYTLELEHAECAPVSQPIDLPIGRALSLTPAQTPRPGEVRVFTVPTGAEVRVGGEAKGKTPATLRGLASEQPLAFEIKLPGYKTQNQSVTLKHAEVRTLNLGTLEAEPGGELRLSATLEKARGAEPGQPVTIPDLGLTLMPIAAGTFTMGSENGSAEEKPLTRVTITQPFWMGKTEVTQREWQAVMGNNPSKFKGDDLPVEQVSSTEARDFCRKLTERERAAGRLPSGYAYTLPTEAQWEYACRAGTTGDYAGNLDAMGWYDKNSRSKTHAVAKKTANAWGLHDMHGNVWEWCADWHGNYPGGSVTDPKGAASGSTRVFRGGGWGVVASVCRSANRGGYGPGDRYGALGFRLVLAPQVSQ